jgi:large subunit ribosomal protein L12e
MKQIIEIAKTMRSRSMAKNLAGTVKEVLGTCVSVGCSVDGKNPRDVTAQVASGEITVPE